MAFVVFRKLKEKGKIIESFFIEKFLSNFFNRWSKSGCDRKPSSKPRRRGETSTGSKKMRENI